MAALKFIDSHNMVAYLEWPTNSDDFTEIIWSTAKAQTINEETQIHALVDGKKIVITESSVRRDLQFANEDSTDCLPTTTIFENLKLMGCLSPKKTAWNKSSSNIAFAIICLATNQKLYFSKMVFDDMTRNLHSLSAKILMYPRIGKDFSRKVTPLFDTMLIQHQSEVGDSLERVATTASRLEAEHVSGNITKTRSKAILNEPTP
ncbi:hypothetical protein Tco_0825117 [Tanacetum coccineum]